MRALAWILLGLVVGAFATLSVVNALRPATAFPKGVMALMQHHLGEARKVVTSGGANCPADTTAHFEALAVLARDIKPAFLPIGDQEAVFARYADDLQAATEAARTGPHIDCAAATAAMSQIGDGCKACHRDFK